MPFHLGSLGFLTPFNFDTYQSQVTQVIEGERSGLPAPFLFRFGMDFILPSLFTHFASLFVSSPGSFTASFPSAKPCCAHSFMFQYPHGRTSVVVILLPHWVYAEGVVVETILPFSITGKLSLGSSEVIKEVTFPHLMCHSFTTGLNLYTRGVVQKFLFF